MKNKIEFANGSNLNNFNYMLVIMVFKLGGHLNMYYNNLLNLYIHVATISLTFKLTYYRYIHNYTIISKITHSIN